MFEDAQYSTAVNQRRTDNKMTKNEQRNKQLCAKHSTDNKRLSNIKLLKPGVNPMCP
jgi:hypothetical protein